MSKVSNLRLELEGRKGARDEIARELVKTRKTYRELVQKGRELEQALAVISQVSLQVQSQLSFRISEITSLALEAIFPDPYELVVEFVQRRGKTECDILFRREGELIDPMTSSGVGAVDVASFALRVACWLMTTPRTRATIVLDEPMRYLSAEYQERAGQMLQELSKKLGIQFIIITHETVLADYADRGFRTGIKKGVSVVTEH